MRRLVALTSALLVLGACASSTGVTTPTPSVASAQPSASPTSLKPVLAGLLDRDGPPPSTHLSVMGGWVVNVHWADIQPSQGGPIADNNAIDQSIAALHQIDTSGRMGLKIRLFAGIYAPDWLKSLGGAPIPISDPSTGASGTVGRFWTDQFGAAYDDLMSKLAAKYDSAPEIREVTISRCTTAYVEPFIRDAKSPSTVQALLGAGFTVAADQQCERSQVVSHGVWLRTRSDLSFNPYQIIDGSGRIDEAFTEQMMDFCRSTLGTRCVLENNSLRTPPLYAEMYAHMQSLGPPMTFQTAVLSKVGDLGSTLDLAISLGAVSVELPNGFQSMAPSSLADYHSRLQAAAARS